jgi:hypothetical protein
MQADHRLKSGQANSKPKLKKHYFPISHRACLYNSVQGNSTREKIMAMISVSDSYMALLQDYCMKTGKPIDRCVSDALFDWLANVAPLALEQMGLKPLKLPTQRPANQRPGPRTLR